MITLINWPLLASKRMLPELTVIPQGHIIAHSCASGPIRFNYNSYICSYACCQCWVQFGGTTYSKKSAEWLWQHSLYCQTLKATGHQVCTLQWLILFDKVTFKLPPACSCASRLVIATNNMIQVLLSLCVLRCIIKCMLLLQVRAGSRALYRPLSASVLSRPETKTEVRRNSPRLQMSFYYLVI